jgi:hypothetical protein
MLTWTQSKPAGARFAHQCINHRRQISSNGLSGGIIWHLFYMWISQPWRLIIQYTIYKSEKMNIIEWRWRDQTQEGDNEPFWNELYTQGGKFNGDCGGSLVTCTPTAQPINCTQHGQRIIIWHGMACDGMSQQETRRGRETVRCTELMDSEAEKRKGDRKYWRSIYSTSNIVQAKCEKEACTEARGWQRSEEFEIKESFELCTEGAKQKRNRIFFCIIQCNIALPTSTPNLTLMERETDTEEGFYGETGRGWARRRGHLTERKAIFF